MKQSFFSILLVLLIGSSLLGQAPDSLNYQAIVRDANGNILSNTEVGIKIRILQGSAIGAEVYVESHTPTTNKFGLINLIIGSTGDSLNVVDWANGPYFVELGVDPTGGTDYNLMVSTSQLLSVPYALHAGSANSITGRHYIGELFGGGIIFMVDPTGQHGLIVSTENIGLSNAVWSNVLDELPTDDLDGVSNTNAIVNQPGHLDSAAKRCLDYVVGEFDDWYLPTIFELNLIRTNLPLIYFVLENDGDPNTTTPINNYWSSNSNPSVFTENAFFVNFTIYFADYDIKKDTDEFGVRAVRTF
jgi:hypothetical protein